MTRDVPPDRRLYHPLNTLKPVAPEVWIADGPAVSFYGLPFPTRMTVVRLPGGVWLHSPVAPDAGLCREIDALGPVRWLVAPNNIHYLHVVAWRARCPQAAVWAAPGVGARAASRGVGFPAHEVLGDTPPADWAGSIDQVFWHGHRVLNEVDFLHRPSRTLILADLIENFEPERLGWGFRQIARLIGVLAPNGRAPLDLRLSFRDRAAARRAAETIIGWEPERIVLAHGRWIEQGGAAEARRAFAWAL